MNWVDPLGLNPLMLNCSLKSRPFTACEQYAAQQKLDSINAAAAGRRKRTCSKCRENKQKAYFEDTCGGNPAAGNHVDHVLELQLGGADNCCANLLAIPGSVNTSFGSQIRCLIKDFALEGAIPKFEFEPPGCTQADSCENKAEAVQRGTKSDGKDCSTEPSLQC
jgi:hypothetical protein